MSDAQREVLKMLADKVITVDEAERLLRALNEGKKRKEESRSRSGGFPGFTSAFESLGETLAEIGPLVKNTIEDVMTGIFGDESGDPEEEDLEHAEPIEGKYSIAEGIQMVIVNDWRGGGEKSDLVLQGIEGGSCRIEEESSKPMRVLQSSSHFVIRWHGGPLRVEIPETVNRLKVRTKNGDIRVAGLGCEMSVKTLAGNLEMSDLRQNFKAKTMGGNINLILAKEWQGKAQAHTMGGSIALSLPDEAALQVKATTMGGAIKVAENIRQLERKQSFPGRDSVTVQVGEEDSDAFIALKTMGGDIKLREAQHE